MRLVQLMLMGMLDQLILTGNEEAGSTGIACAAGNAGNEAGSTVPDGNHYADWN